MTGPEAIAAIGSATQAQAPTSATLPSGTERANALSTDQVGTADFASILGDGVARMDAKVAHADELVTRFALDEDVPIHQVAIALEEARLSVEFATQIRARLVESYRELMNLQL